MASLFDSSVPAVVPAEPRNIFSAPQAPGDETEREGARICTPALASRWRRLGATAFGCSLLFAHRHAVRLGVVMALAAGAAVLVFASARVHPSQMSGRDALGPSRPQLHVR